MLNFSVHVLVQILLVSLFITIFFFTYGTYLEKKVIKNQMNDIASDLLTDINLISSDLHIAIKDQVTKIAEVDLLEEDKKIQKQNARLRNITIGTISGISVVLIILIVVLSKYFEIDFKEILIVNVPAFIAIAITYFLFATYIGANYKSVDSNYVKKIIIQTIKEKYL